MLGHPRPSMRSGGVSSLKTDPGNANYPPSILAFQKRCRVPDDQTVLPGIHSPQSILTHEENLNC
jgi:hypothetical protein